MKALFFLFLFWLGTDTISTNPGYNQQKPNTTKGKPAATDSGNSTKSGSNTIDGDVGYIEEESDNNVAISIKKLAFRKLTIDGDVL